MVSAQALAGLRALKELQDARSITDAEQIALLKAHLLANKDVPSEFFGNVKELAELRSVEFISANEHATSLAAMVAEVLEKPEVPLPRGGSAAPDTSRAAQQPGATSSQSKAGGQGGGDEDEAGVRRSARAPVPNVRHLPLQS